ncbi:MAG: FAD-dependent oxidoreductase [Gammaproteobacteria bacterium]
MTRRRLLLIFIVLALLVALVLDPTRYLELDALKARQAELQGLVAAHRGPALLWAFLIYVGVTALSIPGAAVLTLACGALFGLAWGTVLVSFASTLGATLAFLTARYLLHGAVQSRYGHRLAAIDRGVRRDGPSYLLMLRLLPVAPFVLVNLLMALTSIRLRDFVLFSQLGMLPATVVYVNAGTQLAGIERLSDVASPGLIASLALLAMLPFVAKAIVGLRRRQRFLAEHPPPAQVDRNVIVIGAGSAGLVAAFIAAAVRAKVTLIERDAMGGDCLNTGCVPSKALLRAAKHIHQARYGAAFGLPNSEAPVDFTAVMAHVARSIETIRPHDSVERYTELGVECISGDARLVSPWTVAVNGRELSARAIILATGAEPALPDLPGLAEAPYLTSDTLWHLRELPRRLLVLGGGPIGCEMAQAFARFGCEVTVVEMAPRLLSREDEDVSAFVHQVFAAEGINVETSARALAFEHDADGHRLRCERVTQSRRRRAPAETFSLEFDRVLVALGRRPRTAGLGLEEQGISFGANGSLELNDHLQSSLPSVFACGDLAGPYQFTHAAAHQAWYATVNALFGDFKRFAVDYRVMPWCTFTDPEVARVGLNEQEARARGLPHEVTRYDLAALDRAITDDCARGFVKVLTPPGSDRILGATIVGEHAGDLLAEFVLAMKHNLGLGKILATPHVYPTLAEANRHTAGAWRRAHASPRVLDWLARFHRWRRG